MEINNLRNEIAIRTKNGLAFLISANIIWLVILFVILQDFEISTKNIILFYATGLMLPFALIVTKLIKSDFNTNDHPLGMLGLILNIAQLIYFPIVFWAFAHSPNQMIMFLAIITGAHLFPYGWLYNSRAYYIMSVIISLSIIIVGWNELINLWYVPLTMVVTIFILNILLVFDYKMKLKG